MNRIEDFEWQEDGFDVYIFTHKTRHMTVARVTYYDGWQVSVYKANRTGEPIAQGIDSLEAAKAIAMIHINIHFEEYPDAKQHYSQRPKKRRPGEIPSGVFTMEKLRP